MLDRYGWDEHVARDFDEHCLPARSRGECSSSTAAAMS